LERQKTKSSIRLILKIFRKTKISMIKIPNNSVSLAGEFAVLSQLALRGYDANMTLGHTKGVDIFKFAHY